MYWRWGELGGEADVKVMMGCVCGKAAPVRVTRFEKFREARRDEPTTSL